MVKNNIAVADRLVGTVAERKDFGVVLKFADGATALLHVTRMAGGSRSGQNRRHAALALGNEVEVEIVEIKRDGKRLKISASEAGLQVERVLAQVEPGTELKATVASATDFGLFVTIQEGQAAGLDGLVHVSELPGSSPDAREAALKAAKVGTEVSVEVLGISKDATGSLRFSLSLRAEERRRLRDAFAVGTVHTGKVVKRTDGGFVVSFGALTGFLPVGQLGSASESSIKVKGNVRAKVESVDDRLRLTLTRRGLK